LLRRKTNQRNEVSEESASPSDRHRLEPGVSPIAIEEEMRRSYLDYAMSVIVARALPDVRDGLKPVHRRILFSMNENGYTSDKPYRKSARVVGDVIGKYHPHGDVAIYDALVRMAQDFSMGAVLLDGQGNFGSVDGDPPAAMRYTEVRMKKLADYLMADIDRDTVAFQPNYDNSEIEPTVLPARFPNLLVNGAGGIAVGMATNIPPHNLGEVIDAALAIIDNREISDEALLALVPGPDFPTGGEILGRAGARAGLLTGRGSVIMRGKAAIETIRKDREAIVITEIPYQLNKANLVTRISELVKEKKIEGVTDLRDESNRHGIRVVLELKRDATPDVVLNQLYRFSPLQTSFGVNMLALDGGRPQLLNLRGVLDAFLAFREQVVTRRVKHDLAKARERGHLLVGLAIAVANIDEVIRIIRHSANPAAAREALTARLWPAADIASLIALIADPRSRLDEGQNIRMSDEQARAILDLRLQRLTALGREELDKEGQTLADSIRDLLDILGSHERLWGIIREELAEIRRLFAQKRRTVILEAEADLEDEAFIEREDMVVTVTLSGYAKRTALSVYRTQKRGGRGRAGMAMKDEDAITRVFVASTHAPVLFFSAAGMVYKEKVWRLPQGAPQSRGRALVNLLPIAPEDRITSIMLLPIEEAEAHGMDVMFVTRQGQVRRNSLADFVQVNRAGKIAMKPDEGDNIVDVQICSKNDDILLATAKGQCIRFSVEEVRVFQGRTSTGVRGIALEAGDEVISMAVLRHTEVTPSEARAYLRHATAMRRAIAGEAAEPETAAADPSTEDASDIEAEGALSPERLAALGAAEQFILSVTSDGYGKRSSSFEYRVSGRGGKGIVGHRLTERDQRLVRCFPVDEDDEILAVSDGGQLIRAPVDDIRIAARATQGVKLIRVGEGESVVAAERLADLNGA